MAYEYRIANGERLADLKNVVGISRQARVAAAIEGGRIRASVADIVEQHDAEVVLEGGHDMPPHVLIAAIAVGQDSWCVDHGPGREHCYA